MKWFVHFGPRYSHVKKRPMFMDYNETFSLIMEGNEIKNVF